jgi:hypothetical protein
MWVIACCGIGPISTHLYSTYRNAVLAKRTHYPDNDLYQVLRVSVVPDPDRRRK